MKLILFILFIEVSFVFAQDESLKAQINDQSVPNSACEVAPKIIGGLDSLQNQVHYTTEALINLIQGKVYVLVTIDTLGSPTRYKIIKGLGFGLDEEAIRVLSNIKFTPSISKGKKVVSSWLIPVQFKLSKK